MEQSQPPTAVVADFVKQASLASAIAPIFGPQAQHFFDAQESILSEAEAFSKHWFDRRHTATKTALEAAMNAMQVGTVDPGAAIQTVADWQTHSMQRVIEDFQEWMEFCTRCATHVANQEMRTVEDVMQTTAGTAGSSAES